MNEKILEFARQTGLCDEDGDFFGGKISQYDEFAELIVRACMNNLEFHGHDDAVGQLEWFRKKHFGVKR